MYYYSPEHTVASQWPVNAYYSPQHTVLVASQCLLQSAAHSGQSMLITLQSTQWPVNAYYSPQHTVASQCLLQSAAHSGQSMLITVRSAQWPVNACSFCVAMYKRRKQKIQLHAVVEYKYKTFFEVKILDTRGE